MVDEIGPIALEAETGVFERFGNTLMVGGRTPVSQFAAIAQFQTAIAPASSEIQSPRLRYKTQPSIWPFHLWAGLKWAIAVLGRSGLLELP